MLTNTHDIFKKFQTDGKTNDKSYEANDIGQYKNYLSGTYGAYIICCSIHYLNDIGKNEI